LLVEVEVVVVDFREVEVEQVDLEKVRCCFRLLYS
jgi:hypothetical protein